MYQFDDTSGWFVATGQQPQVAAYDPKQVCFYLGMQMEEQCEKLALLELVLPCQGSAVLKSMEAMASAFKAQDPELVALVDKAIRANPEKWVDADCDQIWVSIGAIRAAGIDPVQVYKEVVDANWAKQNELGKFDKDPNGKILKPAGWKEPDHSRFVQHLKA